MFCCITFSVFIKIVVTIEQRFSRFCSFEGYKCLRIDAEIFSPATVKVTFLLTAEPSLFVALHQYRPPSFSRREEAARRKNNDPLGKMTRCDYDLKIFRYYHHLCLSIIWNIIYINAS